MNKKEVIGILLFIFGAFLLGSTPSPTGAIIGIPALSSSFIGLICFLSSLVLLVTEEGGLEKTIKEKGKIRKTKDLVRRLKKVGVKVVAGGMLKYKDHLVGAVQLNKVYIDPKKAERIIKNVNKYIKQGKY